jgi:plastocyanin domain-containing protein
MPSFVKGSFMTRIRPHWLVAVAVTTLLAACSPSGGIADGSITIVQTATGGDATFSFTTTIPANTAFDITTTAGTGTRSAMTVAPGPYAITAAALAGWQLTGATCSNGDDPATLTVAAGTAVTCTFTSTKEADPIPDGSITVVQIATGGDATFSFTTTIPANTAFDITTTAGTGTRSAMTVAPGPYTLAATTPAGWQATGATCSNGDDPATLTVAAGTAVTCSFESVRTGSITVVQSSLGGDADFAFTSTLPGQPTFSIATIAGTGALGPIELVPGGYAIIASLEPGWQAVSATCDNGDDPADVAVDSGQDVTCTFVVQGPGIVVVADVDFTPTPTITGGSVNWATGATCACDTTPYDFNLWGATNLQFFWPNVSPTRGGVTLDGGLTYAVLGAGDVIGASSAFIQTTAATHTAPWRDEAGVDGFLGFRFVHPDTAEVNYGYVRLVTTGATGHPATIVGWAYRADGGPITIPDAF